MVTDYDFESTHPGSNPDWGSICYKTSITEQGLPEPSSLQGSKLGTRAENIKAVTGACKLIDGCCLALCLATHSVVSTIAYIYIYASEMKSIQLHDSNVNILEYSNHEFITGKQLQCRYYETALQILHHFAVIFVAEARHVTVGVPCKVFLQSSKHQGTSSLYFTMN